MCCVPYMSHHSPPPLVLTALLRQVTYAVCSGSEANDLAFRIARAVRAGCADHPTHAR